MRINFTRELQTARQLQPGLSGRAERVRLGRLRDSRLGVRRSLTIYVNRRGHHRGLETEEETLDFYTLFRMFKTSAQRSLMKLSGPISELDIACISLERHKVEVTLVDPWDSETEVIVTASQRWLGLRKSRFTLQGRGHFNYSIVRYAWIPPSLAPART